MKPSSTLERLARALTGGSAPPPQTTWKPEQASPARPGAPPAPATPAVEGLPPNPVRHRHQPRPLTAWFTDPDHPEPYSRSQSMRAWAQELGLQYATLRWRIEHGWPDMEALGLLPRIRDHGEEQRRAGNASAAVLVVETTPDGSRRIVPRTEVAERLQINPLSVAQRLRQYRTADGSQALVELSTLVARSRKRSTG